MLNIKNRKKTLEDFYLEEMEKDGTLNKCKILWNEGKLERELIYELINIDIVRRFLTISWSSIIKTWIPFWIREGIKVEENTKISSLYYSLECPSFFNQDRRKRDTRLISKCELNERRCEKCGIKKPLEIHHRIPMSKGGTDDNSNLMILCKNCHWLMHHNS